MILLAYSGSSDRYYQSYHTRFPILYGRETLPKWYNQCPLLLGVMLSIAAGNRPEFAPLRETLTPNVQRLAVDTIAAVQNPCQTVQALLLLSWWPLSLDASVLNPSWAYCGLANHTALQFGLHRSQHLGDFRYGYSPGEESRQSMRRTWLACFIVNQRYVGPAVPSHLVRRAHFDIPVSARTWASRARLPLITLYCLHSKQQIRRYHLCCNNIWRLRTMITNSIDLWVTVHFHPLAIQLIS